MNAESIITCLAAKAAVVEESQRLFRRSSEALPSNEFDGVEEWANRASLPPPTAAAEETEYLYETDSDDSTLSDSEEMDDYDDNDDNKDDDNDDDNNVDNDNDNNDDNDDDNDDDNNDDNDDDDTSTLILSRRLPYSKRDIGMRLKPTTFQINECCFQVCEPVSLEDIVGCLYLAISQTHSLTRVMDINSLGRTACHDVKGQHVTMK